jgi:hypothetical protein
LPAGRLFGRISQKGLNKKEERPEKSGADFSSAAEFSAGLVRKFCHESARLFIIIGV